MCTHQIVILSSFNSIKVRLILCIPTFKNDLVSGFNSIKVRLIRSLNFPKIPSIPSFNSIKVRLILLTPAFVQDVLPFQFHKGSINTRYLGSFNSQINMFQFHKGSINTTNQIHDYLNPKCFNSIKVRLILYRARKATSESNQVSIP